MECNDYFQTSGAVIKKADYFILIFTYGDFFYVGAMVVITMSIVLLIY